MVLSLLAYATSFRSEILAPVQRDRLLVDKRWFTPKPQIKKSLILWEGPLSGG
jgi:hypothetical protein